MGRSKGSKNKHKPVVSFTGGGKDVAFFSYDLGVPAPKKPRSKPKVVHFRGNKHTKEPVQRGLTIFVPIFPVTKVVEETKFTCGTIFVLMIGASVFGLLIGFFYL